MKKTLLLIALVGLSLTLTGSAMGYPIVDTGDNTNSYDPYNPPATPPPYGLAGAVYSTPPDNSPPEFLFGQFTTHQAWTITGEMGYIWTTRTGTVTIGIYPDASGLPNVTKSLWTDSFNSQFVYPPAGFFQGLKGLTHYLPAGTYWIGFTVPDDSTFAGAMGGTVPNPMQSEVYYLPLGNPMYYLPESMVVSSIKLGVLIEGDPVPLPPSLLLLGGGLLGLGFLGRRRS